MIQGKLKNKVAIITAAGQGLGEAISKTLAREGAKVAITDINKVELERVRSEIEASGGEVFASLVSAIDSNAIEKMVHLVISKWNKIDVLVNVAGGFDQFSLITDISEEEWDTVINLNMKSAFLATKFVAKNMIANNYGRIISIASLGGLGPNPYGPSYLPYGAAKAGLLGFTKHWAKELGGYGITVNAVSPGTTLTPRVLKVRDAASIEKIRSQNPMNSLVEPIDTAEAVLFLASDESRYITGVNLSVNAGTLII